MCCTTSATGRSAKPARSFIEVAKQVFGRLAGGLRVDGALHQAADLGLVLVGLFTGVARLALGAFRSGRLTVLLEPGLQSHGLAHRAGDAREAEAQIDGRGGVRLSRKRRRPRRQADDPNVSKGWEADLTRSCPEQDYPLTAGELHVAAVSIFFRRRKVAPTQAAPTNISAHVPGSGTLPASAILIVTV
jgi:hypothetical protein